MQDRGEPQQFTNSPGVDILSLSGSSFPLLRVILLDGALLMLHEVTTGPKSVQSYGP